MEVCLRSVAVEGHLITDLFLGPGIAELVNVSGTFVLLIAFYF